MSGSPAGPGGGTVDRYQGFRLESVCWGYRGIFEESVERLFSSGVIGAAKPEVTSKFFEMMRGAEEPGFDRVLKDFLGAFNPRTRWITELPEVFADVVDTGRALAESKHYHAIAFFEALGRGELGGTPDQIRELTTQVRRLNDFSPPLAAAFVKGYARLLGRLSSAGIGEYVRWGMEVYSRNAQSGLRFMEGQLRSCDDYIRNIGRACALRDVRPRLERLIRALSGRGVQVGDLGALDSDELIARGSRSVCLYRWLYLPASCGHFEDRARNRDWYTLAGVCAAGLLAARSFPSVHGHREYRTCADLVGEGRAGTNLFTILEYARAAAYVRDHWPGAASLLARGLDAEFAARPASSAPDRLLLATTSAAGEETPLAAEVRAAALRAANLFEAAEMVRGEFGRSVIAGCPELASAPLRIVSFLPDFLYPGETSSPPPDSLVLDLKREARREPPPDEDAADPDAPPAARPADESRADGDAAEDRGPDAAEVTVCHVYDEWSHFDRDYFRDYCLVHESPADAGCEAIPEDLGREARRVRRVFELLKPDAPRREKRLADGEVINHDRLLDFVVQRRREPSPPVDFYERTRIAHRDVAVLILLDVSGSTGVVSSEERKVIDSEKRAAIVLAGALGSLGDRFAVCGFSGHGRKDCRYWVYKDFDERWGRAPLEKILAARPATGTRIGAALRHSGYRLSRVAARQRLVLVVTDGKPLDSEYDPKTRYAQHDVRRACQENAQRGVSVVCISTDEEARPDLGIMFPRRRFTVLRHLEELPQRMAELYARITR